VPDANMKDIVSEMARGVAGIWLITVIDSDSMVLASWQAADNKVSPEALGGFMRIFNNAVNIFKQSPLGFTRFDDIIFSTTQLHQVIKPIAEATCFLIVSAPRNVPLGMIRTMCNNYAPRLEQSLPGRQPSPRKDGMGTIIP
jgi:predicted regulator of Ras-like GTPase activity (Roadblock/LC7/MglB family)